MQLTSFPETGIYRCQRRSTVRHRGRGNCHQGRVGTACQQNYQIPADATNMVLYVETAESTNNFYLDEAIGAVGGTSIIGAGESKPFHRGDVNADGVINGIDLALARQGVSGAFSGNAASLAADVDQSGSADGTDLQLIQDYLLGKSQHSQKAVRVLMKRIQLHIWNR